MYSRNKLIEKRTDINKKLEICNQFGKMLEKDNAENDVAGERTDEEKVDDNMDFVIIGGLKLPKNRRVLEYTSSFLLKIGSRIQP